MSRYEDIIHLPHHVSPKRERMTNGDRAAQFSSFDALTGYDEVIAEAGRLTENRNDLTDSALEELDRVLQAICAQILEQPRVSITYFRPDARKAGGSRCAVFGRVKNVDIHGQILHLQDGREVEFGQILEIQMLDQNEDGH